MVGFRRGLGVLTVDQDERDAAHLIGAIGPAVVGAALDDDIALAHRRLALVHQQVDLARQHDPEVDRLGAMEHAVSAGVDFGVGGTDVREHGIHVGALGLGWDVEDADADAVGRRNEDEAGFVGLAPVAVDDGRCLGGVPDLLEHQALLTEIVEDAGRRSVGNDDRAVGCVVTGDDAADRSLQAHACSLRIARPTLILGREPGWRSC